MKKKSKFTDKDLYVLLNSKIIEQIFYNITTNVPNIYKGDLAIMDTKTLDLGGTDKITSKIVDILKKNFGIKNKPLFIGETHICINEY